MTDKDNELILKALRTGYDNTMVLHSAGSDEYHLFANAIKIVEANAVSSDVVESARSLSEMTTEELKKELAFIDDCNPSNNAQLNALIDYAKKIKTELNVR